MNCLYRGALLLAFASIAPLGACATSGVKKPLATTYQDAIITQLERRHSSVCVITKKHTVYCWGNKHILNDAANITTPQKIEDLPPIQSIAMSADHVCALSQKGDVYCWGKSTNGQAGVESKMVGLPTKISTLPPAQAVAVGSRHSCALAKTGKVYCWGSNELGMLGQPIKDDDDFIQEQPAEVKALANVASIRASYDTTVAVDKQGQLFAWGRIEFIPSAEDDGIPVNICNANDICTDKPLSWFNKKNASQLAIGAHSSCILTPTKRVYCSGGNRYGTLGIGTKDQPKFQDQPMVVSALKNIKSVHEGIFRTCAISTDKSVWCWGSDVAPELKFPFRNSGIGSIKPREITALKGSEQLSVGLAHVCGLKADKLTCWQTQRVAAPKTTSSTQPKYDRKDTTVTFEKLPKLKTLIPDNHNICAISHKGQLWCSHVTDKTKPIQPPTQVKIPLSTSTAK